jgi:hypothetical protein
MAGNVILEGSFWVRWLAGSLGGCRQRQGGPQRVCFRGGPANEAAVFDRITERSPGGVMACSWASMPPQDWPSTW